ncbi:MAG: very short patch repair endonuclease [Chloroflexota bacterium]|nr:very short patch repair endonuclease [Chloroflexota bacterium]
MDIMSTEKRSALMSRIRGRDTGIERSVQAMLHELGLHHDAQVRELPGTPDFVLTDARVAVFVDGDFWHGWRYPAWKHKLSPEWRTKIAANRRRDRNNHARLRRRGWVVLRIWEHDIKKRPDWCKGLIARVAACPASRATDRPAP